MFKRIIPTLFLLMTFSYAGNSFTSEFSHFSGGLLMVLLVAYIIFKYFPLYKAKSVLIGFLVSFFYVGIDQTIDFIKDGKFLNQLLDFGVHVLGSVVAIFIAKYIMQKNDIQE